MSTSFWLTLLKLLPQLLQFFAAVERDVRSAHDERTGYDAAVKDYLIGQTAQLEKATAAREEGRRQQQQHPDDDQGFDPEFKRP